ncbi:hypothetical protein [Gelidibacter sp.]|uniref:hypothetical protein n=1 Tax=Gelidibacter sp. TaxID=2018083 RepID=UPI002CADFD96|nr:hypothetical protein [Gelidibacter sp.]HUH27235.1 hypothetical protein [Gelidibacter sp.]
MKKVVLTVAIVLGGLSTYATSAFPMNATHKIEIVAQEEFKEIDAETLPQAVKDALAKDFPSATLDKAYVNDKEEYKLDITVDGATSSVYADKDGVWIIKE